MKEDPSSIFNQPDFKETLAKYENMVREGTRTYFDADDLTLIAEYYASKGNPYASDKAIDYALSLYPENQDVLVFKCHSLLSGRNTDEADLLIHNLPYQNDYDTQLLYAELYLQKNDMSQTQATLNKLYEDYPHIDTILDIAQLYTDYQQKKYAYPWIQKALNENPDNLEALELMGLYQFEIQHYNQALQCFNAILDEEPYDVNSWQNLARCYAQTKEYDKMFEAIDFAMVADETNLTTWKLKVDCHLMLEQLHEAIPCLEYIEKHVREKEPIWYILASIYFDLLDYDKMKQYTQLILDHRITASGIVDMAEICYKHALACLRTKEITACYETIELGLQYNDKYHQFYLLKGELSLLYNDTSSAKKSFKKAEAYSYNIQDTWFDIGVIYFQAFHFKEALEAFKKIEKHDYQDSFKISYLISYCYYRLGKIEKALHYMIRGAVFTSKQQLTERLKTMQELDTNFSEMAWHIYELIQNKELDPSPYLGEL